MNKKRGRSVGSMAPVLLIGAGVALVLGVLVWQAVSSGGQQLAMRTPVPTATRLPTAAAVQEDIPYPEVPRISVQAAKQALDDQKAVFLDVRDAGSFSMGHIPGSVNIPLDAVESSASELDPNEWIIIYCT